MTTRQRTILLAVSLLLNVFAVGVIGGGTLTLLRPGVWRLLTAVQVRPIRAAGDALPPADRDRFRETMLAVVQSNAPLARAAVEARRTAADLFVAPDFDQAAVTAALDRAKAADVQLRTRLETAAVAFAAALPADERALLARGLARGGPLRHPPRPAGLPLTSQPRAP